MIEYLKEKGSNAAIAKWMISIGLFVGLFCAIILILELMQDEGITSLHISMFYLSLLFLGQLLALFISISCWRLTVNLVCGLHISMRDAFLHISFVLVGKYLPGKVWGLVGRHYLMRHMEGSDHSLLIRAAIAEQYLLIYTGVIIGFSALEGKFIFTPWNYIILTLLVGTILLPQFFGFFVKIVSTVLPYFLFNKEKNFCWEDGLELSNCDYYRLLTSYLLMWSSIGLVVWLLANAINIDLSISDGIVIAGAFILAVNVGFLVIFAPGGIGVRETVFVLLVTPLMGLKASLLIALIHRFLIMSYDVLIGILGFAIYQVWYKRS